MSREVQVRFCSDHPHRPGPRLSRLAHPTPPQARQQPALRLHLPGEEGPAGRHGKTKTLCRQVGTDQSLDALLLRLNPVLRGWCGYFRPGVSYATFAYLGRYTWFRVWHWLRRKHPKATWKEIRRRYFRGGSWPASHSRALVHPTTVGTSRYRYRGAAAPTP